MNIEIIPTEKPFFSSHTLCAKIDLNKLKEQKEVTIAVSNYTKTRLSTSLQIGEAKYNINNKIEGFNLHEQTEHSYFSGNYETSYLYKLSKKQDLKVYEYYLKELLQDLFTNTFKIELDTLKVNLINYTK